MDSSAHTPELPVAFELLKLGEVDDLRQRAAELAIQGAAEGTIILATNQSSAKGCGQKPWQGFEGNLHCTILLQPEFPVQQYHEMLYVAVVSLGNSIATHVSPMTSLSYRWPNDISIANHKIASVWIDHGEGKDGPWLNCTGSVNIRHSPDELMLTSMSIHEAEGGTELCVNLLLETWARQFITQINEWADRGFDYILAQWKMRADIAGCGVELLLDGQHIKGQCTGVTQSGCLEVVSDSGNCSVDPLIYMQQVS